MSLICQNTEILEVLETGTLPFGNPHSILYAPNGKLFIGSQTVPSLYVLNNINDGLSLGTTLTIPSYFNNTSAHTTSTTYNSSNGKIYGVSYWKLYSLNPDNLNISFDDPQYGSSLFANGNASLTNDGSNLYLGIQTNQLSKINLDTNQVFDFGFYDYKSQNAINYGSLYPHAMKMTQDNQYLIVSFFDVNGCGGGVILKIKISDNTMSHLDISSICPVPTDDIVVLGDYVYVGSERRGDPPGTPFGCPYLNNQGFSQGIKVNWKTMQVEKIIPLSVSQCYSVATDNKCIYFATADNKIIAYNPNTEEINTLSIPLPTTGLNELIYIGNKIWIGTTYRSTNPTIFKIYMDAFCTSNRIYRRKKIYPRIQLGQKKRKII